MPQFRTTLTPTPAARPLQAESAFLALGSCFAQHIGGRLLDYKFSGIVNPFGTLFNPVSIANTLSFSEEELVNSIVQIQDDVLVSFLAHSVCYADTAEKLKSILREKQKLQKKAFAAADFVFLTLGTAFVYEKEGKVVANCHKIPQKQFTKRLLSQVEIENALRGIAEKLRPTQQLILTVSPVRHWKDGPLQNTQSKALLHLAARVLCSEFPEQIHYFPAWEIFMDDLRDYRFYADDLLHPSEEGIAYVWEFFKETWLSNSAKEKVRTWEKLCRALAHRPLFPKSQAHRQFLEKLLRDLQRIPHSEAEQAEVKQRLCTF
jgi:hypothetical protein